MSVPHFQVGERITLVTDTVSDEKRKFTIRRMFRMDEYARKSGEQALVGVTFAYQVGHDNEKGIDLWDEADMRKLFQPSNLSFEEMMSTWCEKTQ